MWEKVLSEIKRLGNVEKGKIKDKENTFLKINESTAVAFFVVIGGQQFSLEKKSDFAF